MCEILFICDFIILTIKTFFYENDFYNIILLLKSFVTFVITHNSIQYYDWNNNINRLKEHYYSYYSYYIAVAIIIIIILLLYLLVSNYKWLETSIHHNNQSQFDQWLLITFKLSNTMHQHHCSSEYYRLNGLYCNE
jgi:hypothetical protein